jgi:hypothetical protein
MGPPTAQPSLALVVAEEAGGDRRGTRIEIDSVGDLINFI